MRGEDPALVATEVALLAVRPHILVLTEIDYDHAGAALAALADRLRAGGLDYPHRFLRRPNTGRPTGRDIDGDGRAHGPRDAQGWGRFSGEGGSAILSVHPVETSDARDLSGFLWRDLPGTRIAPKDPAYEVQRLSSDVHWVVPIRLPSSPRPLSLMVFHATPPVFDGPDDRNGRRNADEIRLWQVLLNGTSGLPRITPPFVIAGDANLDPEAGDGRRGAIRDLLSDPRLQDPMPRTASVDWSRLGLGEMRVSYLLPSRDLVLRDAGTYRAAPEAGEHRLVWIDVALPPDPDISDSGEAPADDTDVLDSGSNAPARRR
ncbi:hypothetical protein ROJ8625_00719 [Roseivivax jejudonensis]|uniref:Endonuclease/exonuclease/phosphatase domain-containing protein n=1 Tax=Roseivivax jejudonensis TaxID=1529041 RepID=A0A1X6YFS2_9RHOB|nr:hypothetical protein ROJ8625_00719 [Roseivivax jejudonensis]